MREGCHCSTRGPLCEREPLREEGTTMREGNHYARRDPLCEKGATMREGKHYARREPVCEEVQISLEPT